MVSPWHPWFVSNMGSTSGFKCLKQVFLRTQFSKLRVCFIQHWFSKHNIVKLNRKRWSCEVGAVHPSPSNQLVVHLSSRVSKYQFYQNQKHGPFMYCYIMILLLWTKSDFLWYVYIYNFKRWEDMCVSTQLKHPTSIWQSCDDQGIFETIVIAWEVCS